MQDCQDGWDWSKSAGILRWGWALFIWEKEWLSRGANGASSAYSKFTVKCGPTENRRMLFYSDGNPAVEQAAQGGCAASSLEAFNPWAAWADLRTDPALTGKLD